MNMASRMMCQQEYQKGAHFFQRHVQKHRKNHLRAPLHTGIHAAKASRPLQFKSQSQIQLHTQASPVRCYRTSGSVSHSRISNSSTILSANLSSTSGSSHNINSNYLNWALAATATLGVSMCLQSYSKSECNRTICDHGHGAEHTRSTTPVASFLGLPSFLSSSNDITYCEESSTMGRQQQQQHQTSTKTQEDENKQNGNTDQTDSDSNDNLPEQDEPTTCTICLINRQGPCRPYWRKFEKCMKDHADNGSKDEEDSDSGSDPDSSPSMSSKCDQYMLPWITCIQSFRNRYTLISNNFFQHEMIDPVEQSIEDHDRILLDLDGSGKNVDLRNLVQLEKEWKSLKDQDVDQHKTTENGTKDKEVFDDQTKDVTLVEGVARINLWQQLAAAESEGGGDNKKLSSKATSRPIEIAFIRDQDGTLLGYEQFFDFKKSNKGTNGDNGDSDKNSSHGETEGDEGSEGSESNDKKLKIGVCNFHINPNTTKSIQIFALYRDQEVVGKQEEIADTNAITNNDTKGEDQKHPQTKTPASSTPPQRKQTLYYSTMIDLNDVPIQQKMDDDVPPELVEAREQTKDE